MVYKELLVLYLIPKVNKYSRYTFVKNVILIVERITECSETELIRSDEATENYPQALPAHCFAFTACNFTILIHSQHSHQPQQVFSEKALTNS